MPYLPYSPDLAPHDLFLFSKLKLVCKRIFDVVIKEHRDYIGASSNDRISGLAVLEHENHFEGNSMEWLLNMSGKKEIIQSAKVLSTLCKTALMLFRC
jgi:hypothetical protein